MKIMFLTQYFPPEMGAPQARISELALRMKSRGHEVSILTAMPNYPTGNIFPAYRGLNFIREDYQDLKVWRCWIYPNKTASIIPRLISYFSFVISSMLYGTSLAEQDVIIVESPPLFLGLSGIYLSWRLKANMVFNVSDLWPDSAVEVGVVSNNTMVAVAKKLEKLCYRKATAITGQSPTIVETIKERVSGKIIKLITNGVDTNLFAPERRDPSIRDKFELNSKFVLVYAGLFGIAQGLGQVLDVAGLLKDKSEVVFLLIGDGPDRDYLEQRVIAEELCNVKIIPPVTKNEMPAILASMDAAIIPLKTAIRGAVPSKIYESMASGLPIIFVGQGDGAVIIEKNEAGIVLAPGDTEGLLNAINTLLSSPTLSKEMGNNGVITARTLFSRDSIADHFESLLYHLIEKKTAKQNATG